MNEGKELEIEAVRLAQNYGFILKMNKPFKAFLVRLSNHLNWQHLKKELEK